MKSAPRQNVNRLDAIEILKDDHEQVRALFRSYENLILGTNVVEKEELVSLVSNELIIHTLLEEEIFYHAARSVMQVHYLLDEAEFEHSSMTEIIGQLRELSPVDAVYDSKVLLLRDYVYHHVMKEEDKIFPKMQRAHVDLLALGDQLIQRRRELILEADLDRSL